MITDNMGRALGLGIKARKILHHLISAVAFRWLATSAIVSSDPSRRKCAVLVTTNVELHGARMSGNLRDGPQANTNHAYMMRFPGVFCKQIVFVEFQYECQRVRNRAMFSLVNSVDVSLRCGRRSNPHHGIGGR
jgi:hypothetical protein